MRTLDVSEGAITRYPVKRARVTATMRSTALALALLLGLAACAPGAFGGANPDDPAVAELQRAAEIIYHRMELGKLELGAYTTTPRSEEHTSELQSRPHLVCRLLLEKK